MEASSSISDGTLTITNTGNVPYTKPTEVAIGGTSEIKQLNIPVGGVKKFLLYAPAGEYSVKVSSEGQSEAEVVSSSSYLTGNVIAVKEDNLVSAGKASWVIWIFLIAIFGMFAFVKYKKVARNSYFGTTPSMTKISKNNDKVLPVLSLAAHAEAASVSGGREDSTIVAIKIKNYSALKGSEGPAAETIDSVMRVAKSMKAKVQISEGMNSAVFVPSLTKSQNNVVSAVKFAKEAEQIMNDHNRKYGQKINFGIGINKNEVIMEHDNSGLKLTSVGSGGIVARKLADRAEANVLLSAESYKKAMGVVKADKFADSGAYKVNSIVNRDAHSGFIDSFVKRQS
jgi:hypothetical protein